MKFIAALFAGLLAAAGAHAAPAPNQWIDPSTGHRVVRIASGPGTSLLYFTQEIFTPQGDKMVITTADGIATVDLATWQIAPLVNGTGLQLLFAGRKSRTAYYRARSAAPVEAADIDGRREGSQIWSVDIDTGKTRLIAEMAGGSIESIKEKADKAMYESKAAGKNRVTVYGDHTAAAAPVSV